MNTFSGFISGQTSGPFIVDVSGVAASGFMTDGLSGTGKWGWKDWGTWVVTVGTMVGVGAEIAHGKMLLDIEQGQPQPGSERDLRLPGAGFLTSGIIASGLNSSGQGNSFGPR